MLENKFYRLNQDELLSRQNQFATLFEDVDPEQLRGLKFCPHCGGNDYQWTDWSQTEIDTSFMDPDDDPREYREYLLDSICKPCEGTGFEGGSWRLEKADWLELSKQIATSPETTRNDMMKLF